MHLHLVDYVLWLAAPLAQLGVVVAMYRRGFHRDFPFFFNYTILQVVSVPVLFAIMVRSNGLYFYAYWVDEALSVVLSFAVLQEIFKNAFRPYEALRDLSVILFRWSALVILLVAVMWEINSAQNGHLDSITSEILLVERSVRLMQCGLVFFLILFSEYLGISRRHILFGVAVGFGLFAAVNMLITTGMSHPSIVRTSVLRSINSAAYLVSALIWLGYTVFAPARNSVTLAAERSKEWSYALEEAQSPAVAESLLESMDRTVERLLYAREDQNGSASAGIRSKLHPPGHIAT